MRAVRPQREAARKSTLPYPASPQHAAVLWTAWCGGPGASHAPALPFEYTSAVLALLDHTDRAALRLAHPAARAAVNVRARRVCFVGLSDVGCGAGLRHLLEPRGGEGAPPRFPAVRSAFSFDEGSFGRADVPLGPTVQPGDAATVLVALRWLPALASLTIGRAFSDSAAAAIAAHLPAFAPGLRGLEARECSPRVMAAVTAAAARLALLESLDLGDVSKGDDLLPLAMVLWGARPFRA